MKKTLLIILICSIIGSVYSQKLSIGPKLNSGAGKIHSGNLNKSFIERKALDENILKWESKNQFGFNFGIGGFAELRLNEKTAIQGELTFNISKNKITTEYINYALDINGNGGGDAETIESEAVFKVSYFQLPLLFKHYFPPKTGPYLIWGTGLNFISMPEIESSETMTRMSYENFNLSKTTFDVSKTKTDMDVFNPIIVSLILGAGTAFDLKGRNFIVDLRLNLSLNKSILYTTNGIYNTLAYKNNEVFGISGKLEAEADAPDYRLEDFRMSAITVSINYSLFKSDIKKDERDTP